MKFLIIASHRYSCGKEGLPGLRTWMAQFMCQVHGLHGVAVHTLLINLTVSCLFKERVKGWRSGISSLLHLQCFLQLLQPSPSKRNPSHGLRSSLSIEKHRQQIQYNNIDVLFKRGKLIFDQIPIKTSQPFSGRE